MTTSRITAEAFRQILHDGLPAGAAMPFEVVTLEHGHALIRLQTGPADLRPGGTVSGPVLFGFADLAMFAAVQSVIGHEPMAVTTDSTVHFLRRPRPGILLARARILKAGQRLMVGEVAVFPEGEEDAPVAHFVMTYSVPPRAT